LIDIQLANHVEDWTIDVAEREEVAVEGMRMKVLVIDCPVGSLQRLADHLAAEDICSFFRS